MLVGFNDLRTINPVLADEWDYEKNEKINPETISANSGKTIWWKCNEGHEWQATVARRNSGCGCPYCSGRYAIKGKNDLLRINPILSQEWNYEKNNGLTPVDVMANSNKKIWWRCNKGHEWQATVDKRNKGRGCPYCAGRYAIKGENDLQTVNPTLAKEWNYEKNAGLTPMDVMPNTMKKVWWKCVKGHEWQASINNRTTGSDCPICNSERHTSFSEYAILFYLKKIGIEVIHSYKDKGYELDIYIPSRKIAIEYDGYYWHKNKKEKDLIKNCQCQKAGIKLYRIRENLLPLHDSSIDYVIQNVKIELPIILEEILGEIFGVSVEVDLEKDAIAIENLREYTEKENSLLFCNPAIANEWNYKKNGNLSPEHFTSNSSKKVWWKCKIDHEWQASINTRSGGCGCPYCAGRYVIKGENDLQTLNPALAKEWNYEKNNGLIPLDVMPNSNKQVWWKCKNGHEWQATVANRNKGRGCPYCSNKKVLKGYNDLKTINPILAAEWNYEKNGSTTPEMVLYGSSKVFWWKCKNGHEWEATVCSRSTKNGARKCRFCSGNYNFEIKSNT